MSRFFADRISGGTAEITGDDVKHIRKVLRLSQGDMVTVCDGHSREYDAVITEITDGAVRCSLGEARASLTESAYRVTLFQGLPKAGKMETIIQKCVELGVFAVQPILTARCVSVPAGDFEKKRTRYQRVAFEASKQSGRGIVPQVLPLAELGKLDLSAFSDVIVAYEKETDRTLKDALRRGVGHDIAILIGPEGGFEESEIRTLTAAGAVTVSLGRRILRTETAGMAVLAETLYELES